MAAEAEEEEEVRLELEAMEAVYGDDCRVLRELPPHLVVHVRPRTADDSSQQFVELFLGIKASSQEELKEVTAAVESNCDEIERLSNHYLAGRRRMEKQTEAANAHLKELLKQRHR